MSGIFICYRRTDSAPWAGRVYDSLVRDWGEDHVFMDVDTIAPGEDFRAVIAETVANSDVVLVVIGPDWVTAADPDGGRRLDDEGDIHRTEVVSALRSSVRVIPVLVGGAHMPKVADLPEGLKDLAFRNAVVLEDRRFGSDVRALHKALVRFAEEQASKVAVGAETPVPAAAGPATPAPV
ncbi:MAG: toll/interleukin-1 receptor domain-containing protein, partial [Acidimicrobiales bacterium]